MRRWTRGESGYDAARLASVYQELVPDRFPAMILRAETASDVLEVVRDPKTSTRPLSVTGSGHSFTAAQLRDGSLLLALSDMNTIEVDGDRARVGPGVRNRELSAALLSRGRMFPTGHHGDVGVAGYLLGGGMGWNGETWGQFACFYVEAVDVVLASGDAITANADTHPDLYWAARGAGPFFPGIATSFQLRTVPAPTSVMGARIPLEPEGMSAAVSHLAHVGRSAHDDLESTLLIERGVGDAVSVTVSALYHGSDDATGRELLAEVAAGLDTRDSRATRPLRYEDLYRASLTGSGRRCAAESAWSDDPEQATQLLLRAVAEAPSSQSVAVVNFRAAPRLPEDAAFSMAGDAYLLWLAQWDTASEDEQNLAWADRSTDDLQPVTIGSYVNETDLIRRPDRARRCFSVEAWERLQKVREFYDPDGRFPGPQIDESPGSR